MREFAMRARRVPMHVSTVCARHAKKRPDTNASGRFFCLRILRVFSASAPQGDPCKPDDARPKRQQAAGFGNK